MNDLNQSESPTEQFELTAETTPTLPRAVQAAAVMQMEQSKILASILDTMNEGVVAADRNETFLVFNPAPNVCLAGGQSSQDLKNGRPIMVCTYLIR
jgi:signal transduction histidine kinase